MRGYEYYNFGHKDNLGFDDWWNLIILVLALSIIGGSCYHACDKANNRRTVIATVTDKAVKNYDDGGKYLIFTKDSNGDIATFEITDSLLAFRYDSSDVYAAIEVGSTYEFTVGGTRNTFLSWYPNIYEFRLIEEEQ